MVGSTVNLTCKSGQWKFGQDQIPIDSNPNFAILNDAQFGTYTCDNVISITLVKGNIYLKFIVLKFEKSLSINCGIGWLVMRA